MEKRNLYYPSEPQNKKEEKYLGKFTNDEFDISEIIDAKTSKEQELYYVTFKKGCRTRPHIHATDQTLVAIKGKGIVVLVDKIEVNSDGKNATINASSGSSSLPNVIELSPGDVVCIPAGALHWHGALKDSEEELGPFSHLAIRKRSEIETIWF